MLGLDNRLESHQDLKFLPSKTETVLQPTCSRSIRALKELLGTRGRHIQRHEWYCGVLRLEDIDRPC